MTDQEPVFLLQRDGGGELHPPVPKWDCDEEANMLIELLLWIVSESVLHPLAEPDVLGEPYPPVPK